MGSLIDAQFATRCRHRRAGSNRSLSSRDPFRSIPAVSVSLERRQCEKPRENDVVLFRLSLLLRNHSTHRQDSAREQHSVDSQPEEAHTAHSLSHFSLTKLKSYIVFQVGRWAAFSLGPRLNYRGRSTFR